MSLKLELIILLLIIVWKVIWKTSLFHSLIWRIHLSQFSIRTRLLLHWWIWELHQCHVDECIFMSFFSL